jgi:hypothetical protein
MQDTQTELLDRKAVESLGQQQQQNELTGGFQPIPTIAKSLGIIVIISSNIISIIPNMFEDVDVYIHISIYSTCICLSVCLSNLI